MNSTRASIFLQSRPRFLNNSIYEDNMTIKFQPYLAVAGLLVPFYSLIHMSLSYGNQYPQASKYPLKHPPIPTGIKMHIYFHIEGLENSYTMAESVVQSKMKQNSIWVFCFSFLIILPTTRSVGGEAQRGLIKFFAELSNGNAQVDPSWGWNSSSDPCKDSWKGVTCDKSQSVMKIALDHLNLSGTFDAAALCSVPSIAGALTMISLDDNALRAEDLEGIADCRQLTRLHLSTNQFSGSLPDSLSRLNNLKRLDISLNNFSGSVPDLARISGLTEFSAQNNQLSGNIPNFDFSNLNIFNLSFNNFSGPIPSGGNLFPASSYANNNPQLCGDPLPQKCPDVKKSKHGVSKNQVLMYSGYFLIGVALLAVVFLKVCRKKKSEDDKAGDTASYKVASVDDSSMKPSFVSNDYSSKLDDGVSKSGISGTVDPSGAAASLIVLTSPEVNGLKFEELLKAPAELIGRGKHGSTYKVICEDQQMVLAVKRVKGWTLSSEDFQLRMRRLDQVKHPNVLPAVAFYCSKQEKLLVYEYQQNGSLSMLLHGSAEVSQQAFDWSSRLGLAATIAEALGFMHEELHQEGIPHGNLKSSNILLNKNMEPCMSEYGLMAGDSYQDLSIVSSTPDNNESATFKSDIYTFGVILLEMLTGKIPMVQNNGMDLAQWVVSVVKEEWTVEVFDKTLIREGASEERMVSLLQVAIKCVNQSPEARPSVNQVALMINSIKEEEERSMDVLEV